MNILVTGGAGFIGSSLTEKLLELKYDVTVVDNINSYYNPEFKKDNVKRLLKNKNFFFVNADITDKKFVKELFKKNSFNKVVHLAASVGVRNSLKHKDEYRKNNILGTKIILETAGRNNVKQIIFASSSSIYGNKSPMPFKEDKVVYSSLSPYAQTKKIGEALCFKYHQKFDIPITIFRFFTVYGPNGRPDMAPYIFTDSILKGNKINIHGDGSSKRDFTYIKDLVNGILAGLEKPFAFEVFNLGSSSPIDLMSFIKTIERITGKKSKLKFGKRFLPEMKDTFANIQKAKKLLGYNPKTSIEEGLGVFIKWYQENRV